MDKQPIYEMSADSFIVKCALLDSDQVWGKFS